MKINLNLFNSIIFQDLRPWLNNLEKDEYKHLFNIDFQNNEISEFVKFKDKNKLISKDENYFGAIPKYCDNF